MPRDVRYKAEPVSERFGFDVNTDHSYLFIGWNSYTDPLTGVTTPVAMLYNPWGPNSSRGNDPVTELPLPINLENVLWIDVADLTTVYFADAIALREAP